ncbi:hypothetical protein K449DRAFT_430550 [Hypoxylon sp. EC38]|nr:hypothetical protein K449DRAFT_430550 [Hypoxylon sp. EC38]
MGEDDLLSLLFNGSIYGIGFRDRGSSWTRGNTATVFREGYVPVNQARELGLAPTLTPISGGVIDASWICSWSAQTAHPTPTVGMDVSTSLRSISPQGSTSSNASPAIRTPPTAVTASIRPTPLVVTVPSCRTPQRWDHLPPPTASSTPPIRYSKETEP